MNEASKRLMKEEEEEEEGPVAVVTHSQQHFKKGPSLSKYGILYFNTTQPKLWRKRKVGREQRKWERGNSGQYCLKRTHAVSWGGSKGEEAGERVNHVSCYPREGGNRDSNYKIATSPPIHPSPSLVRFFIVWWHHESKWRIVMEWH